MAGDAGQVGKPTPKNERWVVAVSSVVACLIVVGACACAWTLIEYLRVPAARRALPSSATEIQEWKWAEGGLTGQDSLYLMKARISEREFFEYAERFGLRGYVPSLDYGPSFVPSWEPPVWPLGVDLHWWDPNPHADFRGTRLAGHGTHWTFAKYENGYVYVMSFDQ